MTGSDLFELTLEGARDPISQRMDQHLILPRTMIVPKNSDVQTVYSNVVHSLERAKRFKPPFREYAIQMCLADLQGMISISSEGGAFIREFNTIRQSVPIGTNQGQTATWFDNYVYGKEKMKNNPQTNDLGIGF